MSNLSLARRQFTIQDKSFVNCIKIDPYQNQLLLSGDNTGKIRLFDINVLDKNCHNRFEKCSTNSITHPKTHSKMISSLAWYPLDSGIFISSSVDGFVNIWDTEQFNSVSRINFKSAVMDVQMPLTGPFSHKLAAACTGLNGVLLIDLFSGSHSQTLESNDGMGTCCCWSTRDENILVVGDKTGSCTLYDIRKIGGRNVIGNIPTPYAHCSVLSCLFTPDGSHIITVTTGSTPIHIYNAMTLKEVSVPFESVSTWGQVVVKPALAWEGSRVYLLYPDILHCCVKVIDIESGAVVNTLVGHLDICTCCDFREKTFEVFSSGRDGFVLKYDNSHLQKI